MLDGDNLRHQSLGTSAFGSTIGRVILACFQCLARSWIFGVPIRGNNSIDGSWQTFQNQKKPDDVVGLCVSYFGQMQVIETSAQSMWIQIVFLPSGKAQTTVDQNKVTHGW